MFDIFRGYSGFSLLVGRCSATHLPAIVVFMSSTFSTFSADLEKIQGRPQRRLFVKMFPEFSTLRKKNARLPRLEILDRLILSRPILQPQSTARKKQLYLLAADEWRTTALMAIRVGNKLWQISVTQFIHTNCSRWDQSVK